MSYMLYFDFKWVRKQQNKTNRRKHASKEFV